MIKLIKEKFLVSLAVIIMLVLAVGSVNSLATSPLLPTNSSSKNNTANSASALTNNNTANIGATDSVGAGANTNSNKSKKNTTNTNTSNKTKNENKENNSSSGKKLPYAGTNGTVVFVVIALGLSAVYAYKKVSDYNI